MKSFLKCFLLAGLLLPATLWGATGITDLRVQDQVHPLAIEDLHPLFSWRMEVEHAEGYHGDENGGEVGAAAEGAKEVLKRCAFLCAYHVNT